MDHKKLKKYQEENGRKLRENLRKTVARGPQQGLMGILGHNFAVNLLNDLESRGVKKAS